MPPINKLNYLFQTLSPAKKIGQIIDENLVGVSSVENIVDCVDSERYDEEAPRKKRVPRRILHFSDGTIEEYRYSGDQKNRPFQIQNNCHLDFFWIGMYVCMYLFMSLK